MRYFIVRTRECKRHLESFQGNQEEEHNLKGFISDG